MSKYSILGGDIAHTCEMCVRYCYCIVEAKEVHLDHHHPIIMKPNHIKTKLATT